MTRITHRTFAKENVCSMLPEQISTLEISAYKRVTHISKDFNEVDTLTYELPKGLEFSQHLTTLIIHYPANFCELEGFDDFMKDLNTAIEALPNLRQVYFTTSMDHRPIEVAPITREKMLEVLSSNIPEYRFYASDSATDQLIFTCPSSSPEFIPTPIVRAVADVPEKKQFYVTMEALEALANLSTFSPKKPSNISIEVIWQGLLKTVTREYTSITIHQNSSLVASFPLSNSSAGQPTLNLGDADLLVPEKFEVHIHYIKCSMKNKSYMRGSDGLFTELPLYIGDGIYKLPMEADIEKDGVNRYKLVIDNLTPAHSDRVEISANLEPIDGLAADITNSSAKSMV